MAEVLRRILGPDPVGSRLGGVAAVITGVVVVEATATTEADPAVEAGVVEIGAAAAAAAAAAVAVAAATVVTTTDAATTVGGVVVVARRGQGEIAVGMIGRRDEDEEDLKMMYAVYPKAAAPAPTTMCRLLMRTSFRKIPSMQVHRSNEE